MIAKRAAESVTLAIFDPSQSSSYLRISPDLARFLQVRLGETLRQKFSSWSCGDGVTCSGLCVSTAVFDRDYVTPTSDKFNVTSLPLMSKIHEVRLMNPRTGEKMSERLGDELGNAIELQIEVKEEKKAASERKKRSVSDTNNSGYNLRVCIVINVQRSL